MLPAWTELLIGVAAIVIALTALWRWLRPIAQFAGEWESTTLPLLRKMGKAFGDEPGSLDVLKDIAHEFKNNNGSTLRDTVDDIKDAATQSKRLTIQVAEETRVSAETLRVGVEATRLLADQDRAKLQQLIILLDRLTIRVDAGSETSLRIESAAGVVADDLAESHRRADAVGSMDHGAAADAASRSKPVPRTRKRPAPKP